MDKLEKHIRKQLEEREIQPSKNAWTSIESQLGEEARPKNRRVIWYAVAASFIGILMISVVLFNTDDNIEPIIDVVDVPNKESKANAVDEQQNEQEVIEEAVVETPLKVPVKTKRELLHFKEEVKQELVLNTNEENKTPTKKEFATSEQELIDRKLNQVLNTVVNLEKQNIEVTDAEIDSLLLVAQREILTDKVFQEKGKVDAMALLNEAEDELDRTFRGQLFEKLKDGFFKVRTAVADRNN